MSYSSLISFFSSFVDAHGSGMMILVIMTLITCGMIHSIAPQLREYRGSALTLLGTFGLFLAFLTFGDEGYMGQLVLSSSFIIGIMSYMACCLWVWTAKVAPGLTLVYTTAIFIACIWALGTCVTWLMVMSGMLAVIASMFFFISLLNGDAPLIIIMGGMNLVSIVLFVSSMMAGTC